MTKTQKAALFDWIVRNPRFRLEEWHTSSGPRWDVYLDCHSDDLIASASTPERAILAARENASLLD